MDIFRKSFPILEKIVMNQRASKLYVGRIMSSKKTERKTIWRT